MLSLNHLTILVTRPKPQGELFCAEIETLGAKALYLPTIEIAPPPDIKAYQEALIQLPKQDWLIFISPQALLTSFTELHKLKPHLGKLKIAAVGKSTADALQEAGFENVLFPANEWNSEGLLALPIMQNVQHKKIAIMQGVGGRNVIARTLRERGAEVMLIVAYQRKLPQLVDSSHLTSIKKENIDVIVCTSYESIKNLKILFGERGWDALRSIPVIVASERIKILAQDLFFQTIWVARNATNAAIIEILAEKRNELWQMKS